MGDISICSPGCSPNPARITDLSIIEEGKDRMSTPSQASTVDFTASPINAHKVIAELVGTYVIIFIGCGSVIQEGRQQINSMSVALAWGLGVMVMIYSFGHVSGAHFNPAVTIAFAASFKFPWKQVRNADK
ncbi:unnamed protein product [Dovyalis caffra]|uniref:Aquaporin n=1 Tax=Dovyalis caffra TaxID=77055 RepID=A0AAV1RI45_9ROSI|nr:unnamed protein product [Dovyalis caffra]